MGLGGFGGEVRHGRQGTKQPQGRLEQGGSGQGGQGGMVRVGAWNGWIGWSGWGVLGWGEGWGVG